MSEVAALKYKVAFLERTDGVGDPSEDPTKYLGTQLSEGVVRDALFVERTQPESLHSQEVMDEDDSFLSIASEIWEYDVARGREKEFEEALLNSQVVMEFEQMED